MKSVLEQVEAIIAGLRHREEHQAAPEESDAHARWSKASEAEWESGLVDAVLRAQPHSRRRSWLARLTRLVRR